MIRDYIIMDVLIIGGYIGSLIAVRWITKRQDKEKSR